MMIKLSINQLTSVLGLTLLLSFLSNLHLTHGIPVHQVDSPCSSFCADHYHSLTEWTSCARGCRFFSLIQIFANPQSLDLTQKSCISTCNEAYNETELRKACSSGCRKSIEMIASAKTGHSDSQQLLNSAEQWIHHLGVSPFEENVEPHRHEFIWPFHFLNDIYKQLTDHLTTSTNWIKSRSTYTLLFGDGSNGRQIFLVRARPHITVDSSLSNSNLALNPIHEQSTFHLIAFPSSSSTSSLTSSQPTSSSRSTSNKQIKSSSNSLSNISPLTHHVNYQVDQSQTFTRWFTDTIQSLFKDLRILMALLLAIVVLSIVAFSDGLCWTVGRPAKPTTSHQDKPINEASPFFILDNSLKKEKEIISGQDAKREATIQAENEQPPTYDETVKTSTLNFASLASSRESKA